MSRLVRDIYFNDGVKRKMWQGRAGTRCGRRIHVRVFGAGGGWIDGGEVGGFVPLIQRFDTTILGCTIGIQVDGDLNEVWK